MGHWQEERNRRQARYPASPAASSMGPLTFCHCTYTHDTRYGRSANYREFIYRPSIRSVRTHSRFTFQFLEIWDEDGVAPEPEDDMD